MGLARLISFENLDYLDATVMEDIGHTIMAHTYK